MQVILTNLTLLVLNDNLSRSVLLKQNKSTLNKTRGDNIYVNYGKSSRTWSRNC